MKIIFDFDHTLFSAKRFYKALKGSFLKLGISEKLFQETYQRAKGEDEVYKPSRHFELIIQERPNIFLNGLEKTFQKVLEQSKQFLYPDVLPFLKKIERDFELILVSYGEEEFQRKKIKKSEIAEFFKKVFIVRDITKISPFKTELKNEREIIFVDDNPMVLSEIKKNFPNITTVRINRREGGNSEAKGNKNIDFLVKNLEELEEIIDNIRPN